jgi:hypothetical protein
MKNGLTSEVTGSDSAGLEASVHNVCLRGKSRLEAGSQPSRMRLDADLKVRTTQAEDRISSAGGRLDHNS